MRYEIAQNKFWENGFTITDESGSLRYQLAGSHSLRDPSGEEVAALQLHPLHRQEDILVEGELMASVHVAGLGMAENYKVDGPAGQLNASGDFLGRRYTLTLPGGSAVAMVSQRPGFLERFDVETTAGQDDLMLLAVILAIEHLRDRKSERRK